MATVKEPEEGKIERDIDGVPLKDHQKVDLKAILGHAPPVDDDEPEVEDTRQVALELETSTASSSVPEDDDETEENDMANCQALRQRRSSLRTTHLHEAPDSPTWERKAVRFADSLGLGLEAIRDVGDAEDPPEIPRSALSALRIRRRRREGGNLVLVPKFDAPVVDDEFLKRLAAQNVLLESSFVSSPELTVSGVVRVTNVAYEKTVTIRYSIDGWATVRDIPANYVPNSSDSDADRFVFIIHLPDGFGEEYPDQPGRLEFAVGFHAGALAHWDNNGGGNYVVDCVIRSREPSVSGEPRSPLDVDFETGNSRMLDVASGQ